MKDSTEGLEILFYFVSRPKLIVYLKVSTCLQHSHEIKILERFALSSETVQCKSQKLKMTQANSWVVSDGNYSH